MTECGQKIFLGILPKLFSIYSSAFFFAWSDIQSYFCRFSYFIPILSEKESYFDKLFRTNISLGNSNTYISMKLKLYLSACLSNNWYHILRWLDKHTSRSFFSTRPRRWLQCLVKKLKGRAILSCFLLQDCFVKVWSSKSFCHAANKRECHWK